MGLSVYTGMLLKWSVGTFICGGENNICISIFGLCLLFKDYWFLRKYLKRLWINLMWIKLEIVFAVISNIASISSSIKAHIIHFFNTSHAMKYYILIDFLYWCFYTIPKSWMITINIVISGVTYFHIFHYWPSNHENAEKQTTEKITWYTVHCMFLLFLNILNKLSSCRTCTWFPIHQKVKNEQFYRWNIAEMH